MCLKVQICLTNIFIQIRLKMKKVNLHSTILHFVGKQFINIYLSILLITIIKLV